MNEPDETEELEECPHNLEIRRDAEVSGDNMGNGTVTILVKCLYCKRHGTIRVAADLTPEAVGWY